ncbi:PREDICTED: mucin-13 [Nanorana parkeri]|uniref:mucin-13 n=1 Tax=Nanorana parkeri TaxID=125878 RepID=UPI0008542D4F|nr:PREDICTED: mucin-13 [Nanorana parkeri]
MANTFGTGTETQTTVNDAIKNYIATANIGITYNERTICTSGAFCDPETTTCAEYDNGQSAACTCNAGLYSSQTTITTCRECDSTCTAADGRQCKQDGDGNIPKCVCLPDYKTTTDDKCTKCDFGYSGDECKDNYLLILVIVGAVLGAAVLILLGAVIGVSLRSKKGKSGERAELIDDDKLEGSRTAPGTLFPKVQIKMDQGQVNRASNVYEDDEQYSRSIPQRDYDENPWYEMDRKDRNY